MRLINLKKKISYVSTATLRDKETNLRSVILMVRSGLSTSANSAVILLDGSAGVQLGSVNLVTITLEAMCQSLVTLRPVHTKVITLQMENHSQLAASYAESWRKMPQ